MTAFILSLLLLASGGSSTPNLCSCGSLELNEQIAQADLIFEGVVLEKHHYPKAKAERFRERQKDQGEGQQELSDLFGWHDNVLFYASKIWKGTRRQDLLVTTRDSEAACGYLFEENRHYLVYAYYDEGQTITGYCTLTKPLSEAAPDQRALRSLLE